MNTINGLTTWRDVWSPISEFRREFDRLFDDWTTPAARAMGQDGHFIPACDVEESEDHYLLTLEMAGVKKEDVKLEVIDNQIVISGERRQESQRKGGGQAYSERRFGRFQRSFVLPAGVDAEKVEANYQDGILRVMVPKAESAKPRQIKITNGSGGSKFFGKLLGSKEAPKEVRKEEMHSSSDYSKEDVAS